MKTWLVVGTVAALTGIALYWAAGTKPAKPPVGDIQAAPMNVVAVQPPAAPAAAPDRFVDVYDIDPLLDPPAAPAAPQAGAGPVITRVGYEEPAKPAAPAMTVPPIPPAAPDDPIGKSNEQESPYADLCVDHLHDNLVRQRNWEQEFRPAAVVRTESIPLESEPKRFLFRPGISVREEELESDSREKWNPLTNRDHELFKHKGPAIDWFVAEPNRDSLRKVVLRVYSVFHVENQRPASRAEWYTRWYGESQLPQQLEQPLTKLVPMLWSQFF